MDEYIINVGPISSFNSLHYYLAPRLRKLREDYIAGRTPQVVWDLRNVEYQKMSIASLAAFLCLAKRVRDFTGQPIPAILNWDPDVQGFWSDIRFFEIANKFQIFKWQDELVGGYTLGRTNPNTRILYFADKNPTAKFSSLDELIEFKKKLKQKIAPNFILRCSEIFRGLDPHIETVVANTSIELIVNCLVHAEEIAFVGIQRSPSRITVSVCDTGIGFPKSLKKTYNDHNAFQNIRHNEGILIGSLVQKEEHGLRLAINEIINYNLNNEGWVIISSYDSEIRWQRQNWSVAKEQFDKIDLTKGHVDTSAILGPPSNSFIDYQKVLNGYWRKYEDFLIGTRIAFEIPIR